ncbi:hypothetical protein ACOSQ4_024228 [Xanthoceras sorbifolium]
MSYKRLYTIIFEGMSLNEQFQIVVLIDKLSLSWEDFKSVLIHKTKEFSIESLITRLRIEEEVHKQDQNDEVLVISNNNTKKNFSSGILKPKGKNMKNQNINYKNRNNQNRNNQNKNNPQNQNRQQPPQEMIQDSLHVITVTSQAIWLGTVGIGVVLHRRQTLPKSNLLL